MYAYEAVWQVQSGHPVFCGGPAGNRGKSSVADYGSLCGTPMRISELMLLHWFDRKNWTIFLRFGVSASDKMKENAG